MLGLPPRIPMIRAAALLTALASLVLVSPASAQGPTIDNPAPDASASDGIYTPFTNRLIYQSIALDYQEIVNLTNQTMQVPPTDWADSAGPPSAADVLKVYEESLHARVGTGMRKLRGFARTPARATGFPEATAFYGTPTFLDTPMIDAIVGTGSAENYTPNQRRQAIQKSTLRILRYWTAHYIDNGGRLMSAGQVDEAWAVYMGTPGPNGDYPYSLSQLARTREGNFGREGTVDVPFRQALSRAQRAAADGDAAAYAAAANDAHSRLNVLFYLATARYLNEPLRSVEAGDADTAGVQLVEGLSFYRTIQPAVAIADPAANATILSYFNTAPTSLGTATRDAALGALNRNAAALLLQDSDLIQSF